MIPKKITLDHVNAAMDRIDRAGIPPGRESRKFSVLRGSKGYPPKYVIALACQLATGAELSSAVFGGGSEANGFLRGLGFRIVSRDGKPPIQPVRKPGIVRPRPIKRHAERCADCKTAVEKLLAALYGIVKKNPRIDVPAHPEGYRNTQAHSHLSRIFSELKGHRGFDSFIRAKSLPNCDFLVPDPGFLVEFDESQHFTRCRELALASYPPNLRVGFDRGEWISRCRSISASDSDPPFRDEQRAWYDTLRDFLPWTKEMMPTIRLWAGEFAWCDLSPHRPADVRTFAHIIGERASFWSLRFRRPAAFRLARIVFDGPWAGDRDLARALLADVCTDWPSGMRVSAISTCGAFLRFDWPASMPEQRDNIFPDGAAVRKLDRIARGHCKALLGGGLRQELSRRADYLTIGIDTRKAKVSSTRNYIPDDHAELVYVADLRSGALHFTGKSYPTPNQAKGLLRIADLETHFTEVNGQSALVLGCHDLTVFNPRSDAKAKGWRADVKKAFKEIAARRKPVMVLHHPHTTVKRMTWLLAWNELLRELPSVKSHLGTGCYSLRDPGNGRNRDALDAVLDSTKSPDVLDIVVQLGRMRNR